MIPTTYKAAVLTGFGGPENLILADRPMRQLKPDQVLVRTIATSVNSGDVRIRSKNVPRGFRFLMSLVFGFRTPRIEVLGTVFAGEVVSIGPSVDKFKAGDLVFGSTELKMGCHAQYLTIKDHAAIVPIPTGLTPEESASLVFGGSTADYFIAKTGLKKNERILINAASGSVGIAMTQIASALGAHVTSVASARNHGFLREHGADEVIDYTTTDLTTLDAKFDVIADCLGTMPYSKHHHLLAKRGRFALISGTMAEGLAGPIRNLFGTRKTVGGTSLATQASMEKLVAHVTANSLSPVIDKVFAFDDIQAAHAYVDTGHKRGNVIVTF